MRLGTQGTLAGKALCCRENTQAARYETINPNKVARSLKLTIGSGPSWEEPFLWARCYQSTDAEMEEKHAASPCWVCNSPGKADLHLQVESISQESCCRGELLLLWSRAFRLR